ncbi:MAG: S-layer homology domain-containing protein, partial [Bifidobacteriaceae bacterium]|nr:S-layer homology domain-containing protein [Bifidobacteriaceae bacterium]
MVKNNFISYKTSVGYKNSICYGDNLPKRVLFKYKPTLLAAGLAVVFLIAVFLITMFSILISNLLGRVYAADMPAPPQSVTVSRGEAYNSLNIVWQPPATPPSSAYNYRLELVNNLQGISLTQDNLAASVNNFELTNLPTGLYSARLYTVTSLSTSLPASSDNSMEISLNYLGQVINFNDIASLTDNFQAAIQWAVSYGITSGYQDGGFHPATPTTRGQMATFFHKLAGNPNIQGTPTAFKDIAKSVHKSDIDWLSTQGITAGYTCIGKDKPVKTCTKLGDTVYYPEGKVTRVQMATFLYRFAASPTMSQTEIDYYLNSFKDKAKIIASGQA